MTRFNSPILITGATGFLGRHVAALFVKEHIPFQKTRFDITRLASVVKHTKNIRTIVHLAGNVRTETTDTAEHHFSVNAAGTLTILEAARINKVKRIIIASSTDVYSPSLPGGAIDESALCAPTTYYGQSKLLAEYIGKEYARIYGITALILRFTYLYGPGMHPSRIFAKMMHAAKHNQSITIAYDPKNFFDALYVKDAAEAIRKGVLLDHFPSRAINISSSTPIEIPHIADALKKLFPQFRIRKHKKNAGSQSFFYINTNAKKYLDWQPHYSLKTALHDWSLSYQL